MALGDRSGGKGEGAVRSLPDLAGVEGSRILSSVFDDELLNTTGESKDLALLEPCLFSFNTLPKSSSNLSTRTSALIFCAVISARFVSKVSIAATRKRRRRGR